MSGGPKSSVNDELATALDAAAGRSYSEHSPTFEAICNAVKADDRFKAFDPHEVVRLLRTIFNKKEKSITEANADAIARQVVGTAHDFLESMESGSIIDQILRTGDPKVGPVISAAKRDEAFKKAHGDSAKPAEPVAETKLDPQNRTTDDLLSKAERAEAAGVYNVPKPKVKKPAGSFLDMIGGAEKAGAYVWAASGILSLFGFVNSVRGVSVQYQDETGAVHKQTNWSSVAVAVVEGALATLCAVMAYEGFKGPAGVARH